MNINNLFKQFMQDPEFAAAFNEPLEEAYNETNSQGQILKRGDLSEYKISDKELEKVRNREIVENMQDKKYIVFDHFNPEVLYFVKNIPDDSWIWDSDYIIEDVTDKHGNCLIENNDEYISVGEMGDKTLSDFDKEIIASLKQAIQEDPDEEYLCAYTSEDREFCFEKDELPDDLDSMTPFTDFVENSYVDGDSSSQYQVINLDTEEFGEFGVDIFADEESNLEEAMTNKLKLMKRFPELNLKEDIEKDPNKLNKQEVLDWISEHELAWEDFVNYFEDIYQSSLEVPMDEIMGWISDHDDLAEDFENKFGISVNADVYDDDCDWFEDELEEHIAIDKYDQINSDNIIEVKPSKLKESVQGKWNIGSNKLVSTDSQEYANLVDLAKLLQERSPNHYEYRVEKTYEDFGAGMQWYTIICDEKNGWGTHQVLNTKQWLDLANTGDVEGVYQDIVSNKYFQDTAEKGSIFNKLYTFDE